VVFAIAHQLMKMEQFLRASDWYRKALAIEPLNSGARDGLINCLIKTDAWADAAIFLKSQISLQGELPGLMFMYGRSLFEAGDMQSAYHVLKRAEELAVGNQPLIEKARSLRERAFNLVVNLKPLEPSEELLSPITSEELSLSLDEFARVISSEKRMGFWVKPKGAADHKWVTKPERRAQDLLHMFLRAKFQDRINVFEEIATGAGRLDLYVQLHGGLSAIIELKMCGFGYSSPYASAGDDQICHYMGNRSSSIGYLVVFDARIEDNASPLIAETRDDGLTIIHKFVDVTPRVSKKRPAR
jgi:tetratricopeptide (TPR) repeat protein